MESDVSKEKRDTITIVSENGQEREAEVLSNFRLPDYGREYIIYTFGERDAADKVTMYVSVVVEQDGKLIFENIEDKGEWETVKEVMEKMARRDSGLSEDSKTRIPTNLIEDVE